jgi:hypothetical protein
MTVKYDYTGGPQILLYGPQDECADIADQFENQGINCSICSPDDSDSYTLEIYVHDDVEFSQLRYIKLLHELGCNAIDGRPYKYIEQLKAS